MKVKKIVFNFITYGLIGYTAFAAFYSVLPPEYQHESFNTLTALISGVSTGGIGSALLLIKAWLSKSEKITDEKTTDKSNKVIKV